MKPENRAKLVDNVDQLREVRHGMVEIMQALDDAARAHRQAVRGDLQALLHRERDIFDKLTEVLEAETFDNAEARQLYERMRFDF